MSSPPNQGQQRVTLRAVAQRARVSMGTASQALSGSAPVSDSTKQRVVQAADELGYVVNGVARALRTRASLMIGMVVPEVSNPFFADLMGAIEITCRERGLVVLFGASSNDTSRELDYVVEFHQRQVDGMLLIGARETDRIEKLLPSGFPVVAVDRIPRRWSRDWVSVDSRAGSRMAVDHLVSLGHRRLAYVGAGPDINTAAERKQHFISSVEACGATIAGISEGDFTQASGIEQTERLLAAATERASAIVAANDLLALGVIGAARRLGIRVPDELSVVGFDDGTVARLAEPALTTIRQPVEELARQSVAAAVARLKSPARHPVAKLLTPELVVRASTAPPAGAGTRREGNAN